LPCSAPGNALRPSGSWTQPTKPTEGDIVKLFEPQVLIIILIIVLIIFGPKQLPELGKTLGQTMKSIRDGMGDGDESAASDSAKATTTEPDAK
jgi:sec-independent protein translocase protein TatA